MLAQNFKTSVDLGIEEREFDALLDVLGMLERGELVHITDPMCPTVPNGFNMADWLNDTACGTAGCIGGWAEKACGVSLKYWNNAPLHELLYTEEMNSPANLARMTDSAAATGRRSMGTRLR
jgi:hypothetical protein